VATLLFALVAPAERWASSALVLAQSLTLACALWTSGLARARSRGNLVLFILSLVAAFANLKPGGRVAAGALLLFAGLLTVAVVAVIARGVIDQGEVNRDSVRGAIAIYVLLGLLFLFVYDALAALASAPIFAQATDGSPSARAYFSFVTLATLGYGDYTPAGTLGRTAAVIEALSGQLYLVTVVALLVSRLHER
jgi:hypothetical protein